MGRCRKNHDTFFEKGKKVIDIKKTNHNELITDFVTGKDVPNIGAEKNRQTAVRFLAEQ